jgi:serine protease Do
MLARFTIALTVGGFVLAGCGSPDPVNETHQGALEDSDPRLQQDNSLYDEYKFKAAEGWNINVAMNSDAFDTYLHLLDPDGNTIQQNDDVAAGNTNSQITAAAPKSGEYTVYANSLSQGETGAYTLTISAQPGQ